MIKKMLTDRRGIAIEMAILMTVICFAVSSIVLSTALLQYEKKVRAEERLEESVILEQIVEAWSNDITQDVIKYTGYRGEVVKNANDQVLGLEIIKLDEEGNKTTVLTVSIEDGKITGWQKG